MNVYTYQIAKYKLVIEKGIKPLDITVKSGAYQLAPTWLMVMGHKKGIISDDEYTEAYLSMLEQSLIDNPEFFKWFFQLEEVALGCYCRAGNFCHRHLLVEWLETKTEVIYCGEISK
ncbi:hypothetical protein FDI90_gp221 [Pseudomonas phage PA7]|uniref:PHIKZ151 n=3 Tax=Viruses TaxID=10239 RepID=Q8SD11_BPDPK|nr:hypothetical protein [Pseudomonas aeruginosa]NP_803717.1 PHIKZ151 [Pseudomonas phage phiKZ]YP_009617509.1 hypothetical protein FDI90_gp221 [Pseudomonas phage PA7]QOV08035.1 hypothetical protein [Pseudomonas phage vB_PaeM_kmuB]UNI71681.1 hypothetical protein Churi01_gp171 [Pseudomonas phage Churi01]UXD83162.1 hypothetical protein NP274_00110 [Pseudomonas phage Koomba boorn-mokiny kep-wari Wadjak 1]WRQ05685.1 hypothetical protein IPCDMZAV_CDS0162 [Pseudomonas phage 6B]WRQ06182.1 hypothetica